MKFQNIKELLISRPSEQGLENDDTHRPVKAHSGKSREKPAASPAKDDLTPQARSRVMQLMNELDRLKGELSAANDKVSELETLADEDPLVPVLNRRGFLRELERTLAYVARYKTPASIIYCDLDGFKGVNDRYGHAAGDATLEFFAKFLIDSVRRSDVVGRMGGDEFAIVLQRSGQKEASKKAAQLMRELASQCFTYQDNAISLAMSVGATEMQASDTIISVLERADQEMYALKSANSQE